MDTEFWIYLSNTLTELGRVLSIGRSSLILIHIRNSRVTSSSYTVGLTLLLC
jgi:hypothetical protein